MLASVSGECLSPHLEFSWLPVLVALAGGKGNIISVLLHHTVRELYDTNLCKGTDGITVHSERHVRCFGRRCIGVERGNWHLLVALEAVVCMHCWR